VEKQPFSRRFGHKSEPAEITVREDAPSDLRAALLQIALEASLTPSGLRQVVCRVLRKTPDPGNWSEYPNVWEEVQRLVDGCEWFRVYDIVEAIHADLSRRDPPQAAEFETLMNDYFVEAGIGWQMVEGTVQVRGPESFEAVVRRAVEVLDASQRPTARTEIHEALRDLSRRPDPDVTGAIQHGMAALECLARDVCGDPKATLGEILKRLPMVPKPLDDALAKAWGYASEMARHVREGRVPAREEGELMVGLAATAVTYIVNKSGEA
jgi:hypothetical protein